MYDERVTTFCLYATLSFFLIHYCGFIDVRSHVHFAPLICHSRSAASNPFPSPSSSHSPSSSPVPPSTVSLSSLSTSLWGSNTYSPRNRYQSFTQQQQQQQQRQQQQQLVRLPPVLWAPVSSRHKQFPPQFRDAVHVFLLASRHSSSSESHSSLTSSSTSTRGSGSGKHFYRSFPLHIWTFILSFASR